MSFEDEKFFSSWGTLFFAFLVLVNFEAVPGFRWIEFLFFETVLGLYVFLRFRKDERPNRAFYLWGVLLSSSLFLTYSSFALLLLGRSFGEALLWILVPAWLLLSFFFVRTAIHWKDGTTQSDNGIMSWVIAVSVSFSGALTFFISKKVLMFAITVTLDILLSFTMICGVTLWLRRLQGRKA